MSVSMFRCYVEEMAALQAEESARLAEAVSVPHLTGDARKTWWEGIKDRMRGVMDDVAASEFTWNGKKVSIRGLREKFTDQFGDRAA